jgi:hypothetical protein
MAHRHFGPSKLYYLLTVAGLVGSFFSLRLFVERRMEEITGDLTYGVAPGTITVSIPAPGHYAVYLEHQGVLENQLFVTGTDLGALQCTLRSPAAEDVSLRPPLWPVPYTRDARAGVQVLEFQAAEPGSYTLQGSYPQGKPGPELLLGVGEGLLGDLSATILGAVALALVPALGGLIIGAFVLRARKQARRRLYGSHA